MGILLEVVAGTWTFKNPVLWNSNGTCKMYILIIDHVHKIDLYTPPSKPLRPLLFPIARCWVQMDVNGDGVLSREEFMAMAARQ